MISRLLKGIKQFKKEKEGKGERYYWIRGSGESLCPRMQFPPCYTCTVINPGGEGGEGGWPTSSSTQKLLP